MYLIIVFNNKFYEKYVNKESNIYFSILFYNGNLKNSCWEKNIKCIMKYILKLS